MDKLRAMEVLVAVVDAGSFAAAARQLNLSAVMVGKHVQQLEAHLGARLMQRSTRRMSLTELGQSYVQDCRRVLEQVRWAETAVERSRAAPQGQLRVSAPLTLGKVWVAPLLARFLQQYPLVRAELQLSDGVVDLAGDAFDVALRIGTVRDESLVARPLQPYRMVIAAAPAYLAAHGTPRQAQDLARHQVLSHAIWQRRSEWTLLAGQTQLLWPEQARFSCTEGDSLRQAALQGLGLLMQPEVLLAEDLASGRLVAVLPHCTPPARPVHLVYCQDRQQLPKLRRFVEHLMQQLGANSSIANSPTSASAPPAPGHSPRAGRARAGRAAPGPAR